MANSWDLLGSATDPGNKDSGRKYVTRHGRPGEEDEGKVSAEDHGSFCPGRPRTLLLLLMGSKGNKVVREGLTVEEGDFSFSCQCLG